MPNQATYIVFLIVASSAIVLLLIFVAVDLALVARNRRLRHRNEVLELKNKYESEILAVRHEAMEQALSDIGSELHDSIGQSLTLAVIQLNRTETEKDNAMQMVNESRDTLRQIISDVRLLSHELSSNYLFNFSLEYLLTKMKERLQKSSGIHTSINIQPGIKLDSEDKHIVVYRMVQELTNNTLKYAQATKINITIMEQVNNFCLVYNDNGKGFDTDKNNDGMGLRSMRSRLELIKATFEIKSEEGNGVEFRITIPNKTPNYE